MDHPTTITDEARRRAFVPGPSIKAVVGLCIALTTLFTVARTYTRLKIHRRLWWDDWTMLPAWMGTIVFSTLMLLMERHGGGVHVEDLPPAELDQYLIVSLQRHDQSIST
jgi:hypothetical protein